MCQMIVNQDEVKTKTQLLFVLPFVEHYEHFSEKELTVIYNRFPELARNHFDIHYTFCKFFWECHVSIPHVPFDELNQYINKTV